MGKNYGSGVSRVLTSGQTAFTTVIYQQGKPPLDAEFTLAEDLADDWRRTIVLRGTPSGWLGNETNPRADFQTDASWSNWFKFGRQRAGETKAFMWACVNGWLIPVGGTKTGAPPGSPDDTDTWNKITLDPPPANAGDFRVDYVFLEAWLARVPPDPSTLNKPASSSIWRYGNVEGGFSFLADESKDPAIGFETTQRVQVQYRIRVVTGLVGLSSYPDGFDPAVVKAQGAAAAPTSYTYTNMRQELGDPGLWRAGDGTANALATVDGYVYAIPICVAFRRNSVPWDGDPAQNLNGGFNRNPTAVDRTGVKTFSTTPTLLADISDTDMSFTLTSAANIPMPASPTSAVLIRVGDELMQYQAITGTNVTIFARGVYGTKAETHKAGDVVTVVAVRPDGLFADQIAHTDILDLRHLVNPNGFDYQALLQANLDKLMRGRLAGNWKRTGAGPQGPFVVYQDKITNGAVSLGVTKLDGPDNIRTTFSDAATMQRVELIVQPNSAPVIPPATASIEVPWSLSLDVIATNQAVANQFGPGDTISIAINQFKAGITGADSDQIRFVGTDEFPAAVTLRYDGLSDPIPSSMYGVTPGSPDSPDDLVITFGPDFYPLLDGGGNPRNLYITLHVMYGPGRGLSRKPGSLHSVAFLNPASDTLAQQEGVPTDNVPMRTSWLALWGKYLNEVFRGMLPVLAEAYADLGSKTVCLTPFRRVVLPTDNVTLDGSNIHKNSTIFLHQTTGDVTSGSTTLTDIFVDFNLAGVQPGMRVVVEDIAAQRFEFAIRAVLSPTQLELDHPVHFTLNPAVYDIYIGQGLMPALKADNVTPKWILPQTPDPLSLFSGNTWTGGTSAALKNVYSTFPRHLMPGWGEVHLPILHSDTSAFSEGINFAVRTTKGSMAGKGAVETNYIAFSNGGLSYAAFSTYDWNSALQATYNAQFTWSGNPFAGMRHFQDTRGLGRRGLELPPFYGVARLFAIYEAQNFRDDGSSYDSVTREYVGGGAINLLRQGFSGPLFWIEQDDDGDATFILNADALDLARSPNAIASFDSADFVVEASIFGFDRGSFDRDQEFRLVLTRARTQANDTVTRNNNLGVSVASPDAVIQAPPQNSEGILINYSRTPYQGDAAGSQTNYLDLSYTPGPLTSGSAYQVAYLDLDQQDLTRPNQKALEVLASASFATTLGTGRFSGSIPNSNPGDMPDYRNVGYEEFSTYPPTNPLAARPRILAGAVGSSEVPDVSTNYLGCTSELPLGALYRDKDFKGGQLGNTRKSPFVYMGASEVPAVAAASLEASFAYEQTEVAVNNADLASGQPGEILVHVDGETANYSLLTNFRTARGGSVFSAGDARPGGEFVSLHETLNGNGSHTSVLSGRAFLVRTSPISVGATEVCAGDELMMLIITTVNRYDGDTQAAAVICGTNGTAEGISAVDLYRVEGRPLMADNVRYEVDPSTVILTRATKLK